MKVFRTHYLIDRDFQLKYAFLLACVAIFVSILIGGIVWYALDESYRVLQEAQLLEQPEVKSLIQQWKNFLTFNLVIMLCATIAFLTLLGILITHKMVGPIFVLKKKFQAVSEGYYPTPMNLRKNDEFQDVKDQFNRMLGVLKRQTEEDIKLLEAISLKIEDSHARQSLQQLIQKKKKAGNR